MLVSVVGNGLEEHKIEKGRDDHITTPKQSSRIIAEEGMLEVSAEDYQCICKRKKSESKLLLRVDM